MGKKLIIPGADFSANAIEVTSIKTVSGNQSFQILDSIEGVKSFTSDADGYVEIEGYVNYTGDYHAINFFNKASSVTDITIEEVKNLRLKTGDLKYGFYKCSALKSVTFSDIKSTNANGLALNWLFSSCQNLETLRINSKEKIKVLSLSSVFSNGGGKKIKSLDLQRLDTSLMTEMANFFNIGGGNFPDLEEINFSGWDLSSLDTSVTSNYQYAFNLCKSLQKAIINGCNAATITKLKTILSTVSSSNPWVWVESTDASGNSILVRQS